MTTCPRTADPPPDLSSDPDALDDLARHLSGCADCQADDDALSAILDDRFAALAPLLAPPAALSAAVLAAVEDEMARDDAAFDLRFAALAELAPPADLSAAVLAAVEREAQVTPAAGMPRWAALGAALALAAALLLVVLPPRGGTALDPTTLTPKGVGTTRPDVALKVAVSSHGEIARYRADRRYTVGDVLHFRASVTAPSEALLVRVDPQGAAVVHRQPLAADAELDLPLTWTLEAGEQTAAFALLAAASPLSEAAVTAALSGTDGLDAVCAAAKVALDAACTQVVVVLEGGP